MVDPDPAVKRATDARVHVCGPHVIDTGPAILYAVGDGL
jgi:hypothetical protein